MNFLNSKSAWAAAFTFLMAQVFANALHADQSEIPETERVGEPTILFDGKTLGNWKRATYSEEAEVEVRDGAIIIGVGEPINGVILKDQEIPKSNYELTFEAQRLSGRDFFATVTFPVQDSFCSLVLGGWGGKLTGLSSLDGSDASENETMGFHDFKEGEWYKVRVRVIDDRIDCWIDDKPTANVNITGRSVRTRIEMNLSKPLGFTSYRTAGAIREIQLHQVKLKAN